MSETLAILLLAVWVGAIAVLVNVNRADKLLWIPILLAVAGVSVVANGATLILFIVSLEVLNPQYRLAISRIRHRTRQ